MADNTHFDMTAVPLEPALKIAFSNTPRQVATHYKVENGRLILAWNERAGENFVPFLVPLTAETAVEVVETWLSMLTLGDKPDIDGECEMSCRIYCEVWGHIDHNHYAFVAIEPRWAVYGK